MTAGARTLAITNGADSALAQAAEVAYVTAAGAEQAVPATKTFTTQLAALAVVAIGLGASLDPGELQAVPDAIETLLSQPMELEPIVAELSGVQAVVVSGRGLAYSPALELALKLKEACYLHAMGLSYADLLHGPFAVVDADTPAIVLAANSGPTLAGTVDLARRVTGARARLLHRRRRAPGRGLHPCAARARAAGVAGAFRPDRAWSAADRGAGQEPWPGPRQSPRPEQGHADELRPPEEGRGRLARLRRLSATLWWPKAVGSLELSEVQVLGVVLMGLLDDAENLASKDPNEVKNLTGDAEQAADKETGGKFDSEISDAGTKLDDQLDQGQSGQSDQSGQ